VQEVWGQAAASLLHVSLPVKLPLPDQHTLNTSCDFDITCKLALKSKVAVVLRSLQQLEQGSSSSKRAPVKFCLQVWARCVCHACAFKLPTDAQVHAAYTDGSSAVLSAGLCYRVMLCLHGASGLVTL